MDAQRAVSQLDVEAPQRNALREAVLDRIEGPAHRARQAPAADPVEPHHNPAVIVDDLDHPVVLEPERLTYETGNQHVPLLGTRWTLG